jgi:hypothetical protein
MEDISIVKQAHQHQKNYLNSLFHRVGEVGWAILYWGRRQGGTWASESKHRYAGSSKLRWHCIQKNWGGREKVIFFSYMILLKEGGVGDLESICMTWDSARVASTCVCMWDFFLMIFCFTFLHHLFHLCRSELQLVFSDWRKRFSGDLTFILLKVKKIQSYFCFKYMDFLVLCEMFICYWSVFSSVTDVSLFFTCDHI